MSLIARKRGHRTTYYAVITWHGRRIWENVGTDKQEAKRVHARRLREIESGTYVEPKRRGMTFRKHVFAWLAQRTNRNKGEDERNIKAHVLSRDWLASMRLESVRPPHMARLVSELKATVSAETGKPLSPKYVANIFGIVRTMFRDAMREELIDRDPCVLPRGALARRSQKPRAPYDLHAVVALLSSEEAALPARVFAALAIMTGMREGEVCGRVWADWQPSASGTLDCLTVDTQYDGRPLKTDKPGDARPRRVPVHPALASILKVWWQEGFELVYCRKPGPGDPIVPRADGRHHTRSSAYKMWRAALEKAGVKNLSLHSTRHTFISMCRRGGAQKEVVERITHNARGDVVDQYTHFDWDPLCEAVMCLPFGASVDATVDAGEKLLTRRVEAQGIEPGGVSGNERKLIASGGKHWPDAPREIPQDSAGSLSAVARVNEPLWAPRAAPYALALCAVRPS